MSGLDEVELTREILYNMCTRCISYGRLELSRDDKVVGTVFLHRGLNKIVFSLHDLRITIKSLYTYNIFCSRCGAKIDNELHIGIVYSGFKKKLQSKKY